MGMSAAELSEASSAELVAFASVLAQEFAGRPAPSSPAQCTEEAESLGRTADLLEAAIAVRVAVVDRSGAPRAAGHTSTSAWLRHALGMRSGRAQERRTLAAQLTRLPEVARRLRAGELAHDYASVIASAVTRLTDEECRRAEGILLSLIDEQECTVADLQRLAYRLKDIIAERDGKDTAPEDARRDQHSWLRLSSSGGGAFSRGWFDPELKALIKAKLGPLAKPTGADDPRDHAQRMADALAAFLTSGGGGFDPIIVIRVPDNAERRADASASNGGGFSRHPAEDSDTDHDSGSDTSTGADASPEADTNTNTDAGAGAGAGADLETDDSPDANAGVGAGANPETGPGARPCSDGGPKANASPNADTDTDTAYGRPPAARGPGNRQAAARRATRPTAGAPDSARRRAVGHRGTRASGEGRPADLPRRHDAARAEAGTQDGSVATSGETAYPGKSRSSAAFTRRCTSTRGTQPSEPDIADSVQGRPPDGNGGAERTSHADRTSRADTTRRADGTSGTARTSGADRTSRADTTRRVGGTSGADGTDLGEAHAAGGQRFSTAWPFDVDGLRARLADGTPIGCDRIRQILLTAGFSTLVLGSDGHALYLGRRSRFATRHQRRVLNARYVTCVTQGCEIPAELCEVDHVSGWFPDGTTDIDLLVPCCSFHNRWKARHLDRVLIELRADGRYRYRIKRPGGPLDRRNPAGAAPAEDPPAQIDL